MSRFRRSTLSLAVLATVAAGCGDQASPTSPRPSSPVAIISDGSQSGGNPDFFFLPPVVGNPASDPDFSAGEFAAGWKPVVEVCQVNASNLAAGCVGATLRSYAGSAVTLSAAEEAYTAQVDTRETWAAAGSTYRFTVKVMGNNPVTLGFVDIALLSGGAKNARTGDVVSMQDGRTIPLKFRIERGATIDQGVTVFSEVVITDAGATVLTGGTGGPGTFAFAAPADWLPPELGEVVLTVEKLSTGPGGGCVASVPNLLQTSDCWRVESYPEIPRITQAVTVAFCPARLPPDPTRFGQAMYKFDEPARLEQLEGVVTTLVTCEGSALGSLPDDLMGRMRYRVAQLARGIGRVLGPNTAYAFDAGYGGRLAPTAEDVEGGVLSQFFWGIPLRIDVTGDATRSGVQGAPVAPLTARVTSTHLHHDEVIPVPGVTVRFFASAGTLGGATAVTDADGVATMPWTLGSSTGTQSVVATITSITADTAVTFTATSHSPLFILVNGTDVSGTTQIVTTDFEGTIATAGGPLTTGCSLVTSNPDVINVDPPVIIANGTGSAVVTATCGAASTSVAFTVQAPPPAAVSNITLRVPISTAVVYYTRMSANVSVDAGMSLVAEPRDAAGTIIAGVPCLWQSPSLAVEISEVLQGQADIIGRSPTGTALVPISVTCGSVARTLLVSVALGNTIGNVEAIDVMLGSNTSSPIADSYSMFAGFTTAFHARPRDVVPTPQDLTSSVSCGWLQTTGALVISPMVGNPVDITGSIGTSKLFVTCAGYTRELDITVIPPIG